MAKAIKMVKVIAAVATTLIIVPVSKNIEQKDSLFSMINNTSPSTAN